jgi:phosphotransferase system enzyme I (PtsI)
MGLRSFSMSPAFIPPIKELTSHLTVPLSRRILRRALRMKTTHQVQQFMSQRLVEICPTLQLLDTA